MNRMRKGVSGEQELCTLLNESGIAARRVPLSGALPFGGGCDLLILLEGETRWRRVEVKRRTTHALCRWMESADYAALREDRGEWIISLRLPEFVALLKRPRLAELVNASLDAPAVEGKP